MIYSVVNDKFIDCPKCHEQYFVKPKLYDSVTKCQKCSCVYIIRPPGTPPYQPTESEQNEISNPSPLSAEVPGNPSLTDSSIVVDNTDLRKTMPLGKSGMRMKPKKIQGIEFDDNIKMDDLRKTIPLGKKGMGMKPTKKTDTIIINESPQQDLRQTIPLGRRGMGMKPKRKKVYESLDDSHLFLPPVDTVEDIYAVVTDNHVPCPFCHTEFEITPAEFESIGICSECEFEFIIKPPGTKPYSHNEAESREPAPGVNGDGMACPECGIRLEISPEHYDSILECPDCACEFMIDSEETDGARPPAAKALPPISVQPDVGQFQPIAESRPEKKLVSIEFSEIFDDPRKLTQLFQDLLKIIASPGKNISILLYAILGVIGFVIILLLIMILRAM